jgi:hypothetical protein
VDVVVLEIAHERVRADLDVALVLAEVRVLCRIEIQRLAVARAVRRGNEHPDVGVLTILGEFDRCAGVRKKTAFDPFVQRGVEVPHLGYAGSRAGPSTVLPRLDARGVEPQLLQVLEGAGCGSLPQQLALRLASPVGPGRFHEVRNLC